jgi:hypothetical protein
MTISLRKRRPRSWPVLMCIDVVDGILYRSCVLYLHLECDLINLLPAFRILCHLDMFHNPGRARLSIIGYHRLVTWDGQKARPNGSQQQANCVLIVRSGLNLVGVQGCGGIALARSYGTFKCPSYVITSLAVSLEPIQG